MKIFYILVALAVLGVTYWYATKDVSLNNDNGAESEQTETERTSVTEDDDMDEMDMENEDAVDDQPTVTPDTTVVDAAGAKVFNVGGVNYAFDVKTITVKEGDTVTINFTSNGGFHDWAIDEFSAATERVAAGNSSSVTFVANRAGTFEYYCSVGTHRAQGMVGNLIVESN